MDPQQDRDVNKTYLTALWIKSLNLELKIVHLSWGFFSGPEAADLFTQERKGAN